MTSCSIFSFYLCVCFFLFLSLFFLHILGSHLAGFVSSLNGKQSTWSDFLCSMYIYMWFYTRANAFTDFAHKGHFNIKWKFIERHRLKLSWMREFGMCTRKCEGESEHEHKEKNEQRTRSGICTYSWRFCEIPSKTSQMKPIKLWKDHIICTTNIGLL